jgi:hypothetical protein
MFLDSDGSSGNSLATYRTILAQYRHVRKMLKRISKTLHGGCEGFPVMEGRHRKSPGNFPVEPSAAKLRL